MEIFSLTSASHGSVLQKENVPPERKFGSFLWEGKYRNVTYTILMAPWSIIWQTIILSSVVYTYLAQTLILHYTDTTPFLLWVILSFCNLLYSMDLCVYVLHTYWPLVRINMRVYRRSTCILVFDFLTLLPSTTCDYVNLSIQWKVYDIIARWTDVFRIYRLFVYFSNTNKAMHRNRLLLYTVEHVVTAVLLLHFGTCVWYWAHISRRKEKSWHRTGSQPHAAGADVIYFDNYLNCLYYTTCRIYGVLFGDTYPLNYFHKWLSVIMMLLGYIFVRYSFIGVIAWKMAVMDKRRLGFIDQYHHMLSYLRFLNAPQWLIEEASRYKMQLWHKKDGVLSTEHLQKLPLPLQMELIFDINVGHFHQTLLFRDSGEAFLRQTSLLMQHEIFLEGQSIWSQGVVKRGMICIKRGVIEMLSDEDDESPMIAFKEGTVLGELSLFYSVPAKVTIKAATYVEIQVLYRTDFMRAMAERPHKLNQIRAKIKDRLKKSIKRQREINEYEKGDSRLIRTRYRPMKVLKDHLTNVEDEDRMLCDDSHLYYRDENNERKLKFTDEYLELYKETPRVTTVDAPTICLRSTFPWILEPDTTFTQMFDVAHFILVLLLCIIIPYTAVFNTNDDIWNDIVYIVIKTGLVFHIYIQLTTAIVDKNRYLTTVQEIAEEKMSRLGFYLDILSIFPFFIITDTLDPDKMTVAGQISYLAPVTQFWHIWDYINKWKHSFYYFEKLTCLMKYGICLTVFGYWAGCFLFLFSCPRKLCREGSWMSALIYWETKMIITNEAKHENQMSVSINFGSSILSLTGQEDVSPGPYDIPIVIIFIIFGSYLIAFYIANTCSIYTLSSRRKQAFRESMRELFYFLSFNNVGDKIKARVAKFFSVQWYYNNGVSTSEIFENMPTKIRQEVIFVELVETLLCCPFFKNCSRDFLQTIAANTRTIVLPDNEVVQHAADITRDMYILQKGHCNLLKSNTKSVISKGPGSEFGLVEMFFNLPKVYTVVTTTNCIILQLEYSALMQCLSIFPDVHDHVTAVLQDDEVIKKAMRFEDPKPLTGRIETKINRIAQEIKESFVALTSPQVRSDYFSTFDRLGVMRFIKFFVIPGCITPHGIFLKIWCWLRFFVAIFYILVVPYDMAVSAHTFDISHSPDYCDIILYIDLIVMSYVAYYDHRNILITHPLFTMSHYLRHAFLLDFITVFPFEDIILLMNKNVGKDCWRVNRMLQVFRITGTIYYLESDIVNVNQVVVLLKFLPFAVTLVNMVAALMFHRRCRPYINANSSFIMVNCTKTLITNDKIVDTGYGITEYMYTFYSAFEIFFGCGSTSVTITNFIDFWIITVLLTFGTLYFGFMFGYVASTRSATSTSLLDHTERTRDLSDFLYQANVDPILTDKTLRYFEYIWKRTNGGNPQKNCRLLSSALMEDTLVFMYEKTLREVPLFGNVDRSFIRVITQHLNEMYFLKGETVIQCRDVQPYIYIIYRGKVDVLSYYNEMLTCMGPGGMFGNFTGKPISCSEVSIYASRSLDLLVIPSQTFFNLIKYYPKIQEPLNKAFERSKDYILPITVDLEDDDDSISSDNDESNADEEVRNKDDMSYTSETDQHPYETAVGMSLSMRNSHSNVSYTRSSSSRLTYQSATILRIYRSGSYISQLFGYLTCLVATANFLLISYDLITSNKCMMVTWPHFIIDVFFYLKIYVSMHQSYNNRRGEVVTQPSKCRAQFFKNKWLFWTDFLINIPIEPIALFFEPKIQISHYLRAKKMLRIKYLLEFYNKTAAQLTNNITMLQTAMTFLTIALLLHAFACVWLLILTRSSPEIHVRILKVHLLDDQSIKYRWDFTTSFYIITSEVTETGLDEYFIDDSIGLFMMAVSLICGKVLSAIVVATAMQVAYSLQYALIAYEKQTTELIDVLKNQGLSAYQMKKLWSYVKQLWISERGRQLPTLLAKTPYVRRCDLMTAMFGTYLRNCFIFADAGEPFLRQLAVVLDYTIFFPGNYIVVAGDSEPRIFWVVQGTVSVVSVRSDLTETTHELLRSGDVFGIMQGFNRGLSHCFSYRAETKVSVVALSLDSWIHILQFFPEAQKSIAKRTQILFTDIAKIR